MNDLLDFQIAQKFQKAILAGRKKAGKKVGGAFVRRRRSLLGKADKRRKKAVISRVSRAGTLILYDLAPMSGAQEFGATIKPKSKAQLFVRTSELKPGELPVRRGDYLLAVKKGAEPRLLGVYRDTVETKQVSSNRRFFDQIEDFTNDYEAALNEFIDNRTILL